jgi:acetyl-CoA C-acetyltransferase
MTSPTPQVVIASAARTPIGAFQGTLASLKASELGATAIKEAVQRANLNLEDVDLVIMGNVLPAGMGQAPARQAAIYGGLAQSTPTVTVNKMCGSGMEAIIQAARAVALGDATIAVAGGMESMSNAPYLLPGARNGLRFGHGELLDSMLHDGLIDAYGGLHMGNCAELSARKYNYSREDQDAFAVTSYKRALEAIREGAFEDEIVPVEVRGRKGNVTLVAEDESPKKVNFDKLPTLKPAFEEDGTVTAANASSINDGAAAVVICSEETAKAKNLPILARICGTSAHALEPEWFTLAPVGALEKLLTKLAWSTDSVDLYEINEAYAVVTMAATQEHNLNPDHVNIHGGAVALGHPIGASATRILVTLLYALKRHGKTRGVASMCIGGGEALAMGIELVSET